jgi:uncharacterized RDD family membrane protein YckC
MMNYPYTAKRVGATLADYTLTFGLTFVYIIYFGKNDGEAHYTIEGLPTLVPVLFWFVYFVFAEWYLGGTLGHQFLKLKVVSMDNKDLTFGQVAARRLCDALEITWCFGFIAFLLIRSTQHHQRLGDLVAKTRVIGRDDDRQTVEF